MHALEACDAPVSDVCMLRFGGSRRTITVSRHEGTWDVDCQCERNLSISCETPQILSWGRTIVPSDCNVAFCSTHTFYTFQVRSHTFYAFQVHPGSSVPEASNLQHQLNGHVMLHPSFRQLASATFCREGVITPDGREVKEL